MAPFLLETRLIRIESTFLCTIDSPWGRHGHVISALERLSGCHLYWQMDIYKSEGIICFAVPQSVQEAHQFMETIIIYPVCHLPLILNLSTFASRTQHEWACSHATSYTPPLFDAKTSENSFTSECQGTFSIVNFEVADLYASSWHVTWANQQPKVQAIICMQENKMALTSHNMLHPWFQWNRAGQDLAVSHMHLSLLHSSL